ncbi:hypothetical protein R1flu_021621 [Riccia fluitans]|uniref:Pre-mRNA splicing factor component Cdc5p/Cef1 C-terminal domain-containing protein n=1 Tax=Riccia fluitans TaxID=41844 RepID=A0ABD1ZQ49_9MARC
MRLAELKRNLRAGLGDLPAPKNEYQIVVPNLPAEESEPVEQMEEDMSEVLARQRAEEAAKQAMLLRKRSKVLQRELPHPPPASVELMKSSLKTSENVTYLDEAEELIRQELVDLLEHDAVKYPVNEEAPTKETRKLMKLHQVEVRNIRSVLHLFM